jgi:two-component system chemotaxis response regulator CheY
MAKQILVVEDSQAIRGLIATLMEADADHVVTEAHDGFAALRLLPHQQFDLIITDINMPDINGLELLHYVRQSERHRNVPVVIVTSESSEQDRQRGLALGASDYLTKPFAADTFLGVVHRLLGP